VLVVIKGFSTQKSATFVVSKGNRPPTSKSPLTLTKKKPRESGYGKGSAQGKTARGSSSGDPGKQGEEHLGGGKGKKEKAGNATLVDERGTVAENLPGGEEEKASQEKDFRYPEGEYLRRVEL